MSKVKHIFPNFENMQKNLKISFQLNIKTTWHKKCLLGDT